MPKRSMAWKPMACNVSELDTKYPGDHSPGIQTNPKPIIVPKLDTK